jgi:hypothetical protein
VCVVVIVVVADNPAVFCPLPVDCLLSDCLLYEYEYDYEDYYFVNNSSFNVPRLAARRRTGNYEYYYYYYYY